MIPTRYLLAVWALLLTGIACLGYPSRDSNYNKSIAAGGACSQYTTFIARTSGTSGTEQTAYQNLICGMVTDGTWTNFDALYLFATNSTASANLNLVSTSFGLTCVNAPTFTADRGYTGNAFNTSCDPSYTPSTNGSTFTRNAAHFGTCVLTNRTSAAPYTELGTTDGTNAENLEPFAFSTLTSYNINDNNFNVPSVVSTSQGTWVVTRTSSSNVVVYVGGSAVITNAGSTSSGLPTADMLILAQGGITPTGYTADQIGAAFWGGTLTAGQAASVTSRISAFITAVGGSGC